MLSSLIYGGLCQMLGLVRSAWRSDFDKDVEITKFTASFDEDGKQCVWSENPIGQVARTVPV